MKTGIGTFISSNATTVVSAVPCTLERIVVGETAAGTIKVYDHASGATNQRAELKSSIVEGAYDFDIHLKNGCTVITSASPKITVVVS